MSELVDWSLAKRIAMLAAGEGSESMTGRVDLGSAGVAAELSVLDYTGLRPVEALPAAEWVSRREWARINLDSMRGAVGLIEARIEPGGASERARALAGPIVSRTIAVELGALIGFASRKVLGQYEFPLLGPAREPRLVFVGANLDRAAAELPGDPQTVLDWVALHEVTHAVHFASAPWLRAHLGGLAESVIADSKIAIDPTRILAGARLASTDPRRLLDELAGSDPLTLLSPPPTRALIGSIQATMAAIEGYAEHVMDAAAGELGSAVAGLRSGIERRREQRGPLARLLSWLLGMELKLRQYRDGKQFADAVVERVGIGGLNRAWDGPEALPSLAELAAPGRWIERSAPAPSSA